jgi:hypothetical protein
MDKTAVLGLRFGLRDAFNLLLQGHDVGPQDSMVQMCIPRDPSSGTVHIFGTATANAAQGATFVDLTYVLDHCVTQRTDNDPTQTYKLTFTGTIREVGTIAVQPSSTTSLGLSSDSLTISGTVEDPALDYEGMACPMTFAQSGNQMTGNLCGRDVGLTL